MYLPRSLISHLYSHLLRSHHPLSPPVLILAALEPDALCACRILTALLKRDYIPHKIQPIAGYGDLARAGEELVRPMQIPMGGSGGVVICMGVGGLVDLGEILGLETDGDAGDMGGVEVWVIDARRPWNLGNVFGGYLERTRSDETNGLTTTQIAGVDRGRITEAYKPGRGGIIVYDDGDIDDDLTAQREAYCGLESMPELDDNSDEGDTSDSDLDEREMSNSNKKRKSWSSREDEDSEDEDEPPRQRRRSNSGSSISTPNPYITSQRDSSQSSRSPSPPSGSVSPTTPKAPSARTLRRRLIRLKRKHEGVLRAYYSLGTSYSEPISSILYSLASELGREDNDLLWLAIIGVCSLELSGRTMSGVGISDASESGGSAGWGGGRGERIRQILRDEVRRLNPPDDNEAGREALRSEVNGVIPTTGRSPTDTSILLSPEPRLLLLRHWSLYDSMLHSPYLAPRLHIWNEVGRKRLRKLLAKMGVSLTQCHQNYTHMAMDLKRDLRQKMLKYAPMYGLEGLVPPPSSGGLSGTREGWGFVRNWGWKACLSATDVSVILGAILEVGSLKPTSSTVSKEDSEQLENNDISSDSDLSSVVSRFWDAYDALSPTSSESPTQLLACLPLAQHLHRAILRTGASLLSKKQIRHLRAFRIAVVKDGPDVKLFTNPGALTKLALWVGEAVRIQEKDKVDGYRIAGKRGMGTPLVLAGLDEDRDVYVVVGTGGGGGVIDFAGATQRKEERKKKKELQAQKRAEREERRAKRAAERAEKGDDEADEEEDEEEEDSSSSGSDSESEDEQAIFSGHKFLKNRFGIAFQEVVRETNARVRIDSFEHCVVEVQKEDLGGFLEALSFRSVVG
ncbi:conserved hypothetical protein [Uncinocarpus reesii 1704]|uniref:DNA replication initiation factor Cdc45 n=1 Tax=Uncinocarpus reesii (strain UAMH 1704) TaxID=336963 RepID=C4JY99_UNCRE|nr:uncharacterized protein UREG_07150 [Uncinocarpus reesii 1704]EEP82285.1 conserved hypothetical protein [Uncinocarpus reesii 1704]